MAAEEDFKLPLSVKAARRTGNIFQFITELVYNLYCCSHASDSLSYYFGVYTPQEGLHPMASVRYYLWWPDDNLT